MDTTIQDIVDRLAEYAPDADQAPVMQAYLIAAQAHHGQFRKSGEAYLSHPLAVAGILAGMRMDVDTIATALLHDALEDNPMSKAELAAQMGPVVTELVDGVTKIGKLRFRSKAELQAENFRKMMLAMSRDLRVILVKLADRLHNMRTLDGHKPDKQRTISQETREVYAPIANRLGLQPIKAELEDLCFKYLEPEAHARITSFLDATQADRHAFIHRVTTALERLLSEHGIEGSVKGRVKAPSSIYRKMKKNRADVDDLQDILAFRVVVPDLSSCYALLGFVHAAWPPVPGRIKDYIARPKPNGYQSLHTTAVGPEDRLIEVQIRTEEMHRIAERGIAAHWQYKEGHLALDPNDVIEIAKIREAFENAQETDDASEFMETVKVAFYADEVFVFTPAGEVKKFPLGATPLDFAYAVHSDIGDTCTGARVNGRMVPLDYELQSGESVEILTSPHQHPRRDWLDIAKTSSAITKIRRWLRKEEETSAVRMGRDMLAHELRRLDWSIDRAKQEGRLPEYLETRGLKEISPVLVEIARGTRSASEVAKAVLPKGAWRSPQEDTRNNRLRGLLESIGVRKNRSPVLITGEDGLLVHYAACCNPLPGEAVGGFITRGRGISVHSAQCDNFKRMDETRKVEVAWDREGDARHSNTLEVFVENRTGVLSAISQVCEREQVNIERADARGTQGPMGRVLLQIAVRDVAELKRVMEALTRIPEVRSVERVQG